MDHEAFLGTTIAAIAGEKAGIIKRGVPCIIGPQSESGLDVMEARAAQCGAPVLAYGQHWHSGPERDGMIYQDELGLLDLPLPILPGLHQIQNAGMALAALRHLGCDEAACTAGLTQAVWPARMQRLRSGPLANLANASGAELWLDGGHNPAAGAALALVLRSLPKRPTHMICGMLNTKDVDGYLAPLAEVAISLTGVSIPGEANTLPADQTAQAAQHVGLAGRAADTVTEALQAILADDPHARVLICGSLYLAGAVLRENG
jgi:dihydrofolate synthase/folylpolyglutamate synthase